MTITKSKKRIGCALNKITEYKVGPCVYFYGQKGE